MKVFISHQKADSTIAMEIASHLRTRHAIYSYVDVIDPYIGHDGNDLANHIRTEMAKCSQLIAVVSYSTKESQWVPWEIGVASEKDFPLATYADMQTKLPEFLEKWPVLRSMAHVDAYANASKSAQRTIEAKKASYYSETKALKFGVDEFYRSIKSGLRSPIY
jgi:TIR domain